MKSVFLVFALCVIAANWAAASEESISYKPMNSGVEIIFNADGSDWQQIKAFGEADLNFGDSTDVRQARKKAVLRAKADLSKFMNEKITTEETSEEITKLCLTANTSNNSSAGEEGTRKIVDTTIEKIVNQSSAILKGVLELESDENVAKKYVRVVIGVSRKSIGIADSVGKSFKGQSTSISTGNGFSEAESKVRRSKNYDSF